MLVSGSVKKIYIYILVSLLNNDSWKPYLSLFDATFSRHLYKSF